MSKCCHHCGADVSSEVERSTQFRQACESCGNDLHVCLNCTFYDEGAHHECREPQAEWVKHKERANRCEYFQWREGAASKKADKGDVLAALDSLFKK